MAVAPLQTDAPPAYTEATKEGPPAYEKLFPVKELMKAKETSGDKKSFAAKICQIVSGSFACLCCLLVFATLPVAMVVIGAIYLGDCPGQRFIPIWLIVYGSISLLHTVVSSLKYVGRLLTKKEGESEENRNQKAANRGGSGCESLLSLFLFIWTIVGSVWVFSYYYSTWLRLDCTNNYNFADCQCHQVPFFFSYATLLLMYCVALLICFCGCCCIVCLGLFAGSAAE